MSVKSVLSQHWFACFCSVSAGLLSVAPYLLAQCSIGSSYEGIPFLFQANEDFYLARIREIFDGHGFVSSPFLYEYKNFLPLVFPFGEYFYAILALLVPLSLPHVLVFTKFLLPALLFVLVYVLIRILLSEQESRLATITALAGSVCVVVGVGLVEYNDVVDRLLHGSSWSALSIWTRPVNPITGALFLFSFLILLALNKRSYPLSICAGMLLTIMTGYVFSFAVAGAVLFVLWCHAFYFRDWPKTKELTTTGVIPFLFVSLYALAALSNLGDGALGRNGLLLGHTPLFNKITLLTLAFVIFCWWWANRKGSFSEQATRARSSLWFSLSLLFGSLIALNQQVVTGVSIWPYHLVQYTTPLAIVSALVVGALTVGFIYPRLWRLFLIVVIAVCILFSAWNATTYTILLDQFKDTQRFAPVFVWLNNNAPHDCVVLAAEDERMRFTNLVPGFTSCNTYNILHTSGNIPMERIEHNYFVQLRLRGVNAESIESYLVEHEDEVLARYYGDWHELFSPLEENTRISALLPDIGTRYRTFLKTDFKEEIRRYRADYLADAGNLNLTVLDDLHAQLLFENAGVRIYAF